ncbi:MAG: ribosomal RNA small subunit methyltransferase A [Candidatus Aenigmarchaeota archaeon]|nr:ribosomal RNA small subunit methyltransferase A [Candidatus Aenigmarchaeota archaeon]
MSDIHDLCIRPAKKLGQNFLVDKNIVKLEIKEAEVSADETVLEIGAGYGALTLELAKMAKKVIAVEIDDELVPLLEKRLAEEGLKNVDIICEDVLKAEMPPFDKCVSNIPYQISSKIIEMLGKYGEFSVLIMQKEFAERLVAQPGEKNYSRISILAQYHFIPVFVRKVGKKCFYPVPKVDSAIVKLFPRKVKPFVSDENFFFQFVKAVFIHKNQKLWKAVSHSKREMEVDKKILSELGKKLTDADVKVKDLDIDRVAAASNEMYALFKEKGLKI